jgi:hypothetical protein
LRDKEPTLQEAAMSWKEENIWWDLQEGCHAVDRETSDWDFQQVAKNEDWTLWRGRPSLKWKMRLHTE